MPWFKIDDSAHSHPKWVKAGNAAIGLWTRCGSYSAEHLTEGIIPGVIAQMYGTEPQARKLVKVGLWHETGHDCDRCPQPMPGDYAMHDFFEGGRNTTRAQAHAAREAAAERQRRHRSKRNKEEKQDFSPSNRLRKEDEKSPNPPRKDPQLSDQPAGQDGLSQRDPTDGVTPPHAMPATSFGSSSIASKDQQAPDGPPTWAQPLLDQMHAHGLSGISWNLNPADWITVDALIKAKGVLAMADYAARASTSARKPVVSAKYFIPGWKELSNTPANGQIRPALRAVAGGKPTDLTQIPVRDRWLYRD